MREFALATTFAPMRVRVGGRSSSHNTRIVRVFAHELGVAYDFQPIGEMLSQSSADYLGNPALKLPILETADGTWFGALNICRELARNALRPRSLVWPEALTDRIAANAQELVMQGMATEVSIIMGKLGNPEAANRYEDKNRESLRGSLVWLEEHLPPVLQSLRQSSALSYLEVSAFCFVTHLAFRQILDTAPYQGLNAFCRSFAERESARITEYKFDQS